MDEIEENGQFKMRLDGDVEDTVIPSSVDELRLEKISTRVTIISVLIPVLIVIVLVIAYLDIKKRVVQTEDTGSMSFQNLSKDLESRFSSLSLRQARLEEQMASFIDRSDQVFTRIEIKLKDLDTTTQSLPGNLASKKALNTSVTGIEKKLHNIAMGLEETQVQIRASSDQWHSEMEQWQRKVEKEQRDLVQLRADLDQLRADLAEISPQLTDINDKLTVLENEKIDKPVMDLALSLEGLKIKQALKAPLEQLAQKVDLMEKQIKALKKQVIAPQKTPSPPAPKPQSSVQQSPTANTNPTIIKEQTIRQ